MAHLLLLNLAIAGGGLLAAVYFLSFHPTRVRSATRMLIYAPFASAVWGAFLGAAVAASLLVLARELGGDIGGVLRVALYAVGGMLVAAGYASTAMALGAYLVSGERWARLPVAQAAVGVATLAAVGILPIRWLSFGVHAAAAAFGMGGWALSRMGGVGPPESVEKHEEQP